MKAVKPTVTVVCLTGAALLIALFYGFPETLPVRGSQPDGDPSAVTVPKLVSGNIEPPMSVFNDKLCRFKFRLEYTDVVTDEEAKLFMQRYANHGPKIIGAYPDVEANLLVVIGPPEADQAIRNHLATLTIELQGLPRTQNLKLEKRILQSQGRELIRNIARIEVAKVKLATAKDERSDTKDEALDLRLQALGAELDVVEQQIQVLDKYLKRLSEQPYGT